MRLLLALLAASLPVVVNGQIQLTPAGEFAARDGRPGTGRTWKLGEAEGVALAARMNAVVSKTPIVIDYDHQTLHLEKNGQKAVAAGWIKRVEWLAGKGLFADVEWTPAAKAHIDAGEYRYVSPVLHFDKDTGQVHDVLLAALVNYPALLGMEPALAHLSAQPHLQEPFMDLAALIAILGLPADTTEAKVREHLAGLVKRPATLIPAALATALAIKPDADEAAALSAVTAIKAAGAADPTTLATITGLQGQVAALTAAAAARELTEAVDGAIRDKKLLPAQRDWAINLGKANLAALQAFIKDAPALPLNGQVDGAGGGGGGGAPSATDPEALKVAAAMGITPAQWAKHCEDQAKKA